MSHRTCSYIGVYITAVANSVMLQLYWWHHFYNAIFKIKHELYTASGSAPLPKWKIPGAHLDRHVHTVWCQL